MTRFHQMLSNTRLGARALLLPLFAALCLASPGQGKAAQCFGNIQPGWLTPPITPPDPADRFAIADLISHFYWARDAKITGGLSSLFTTDVVYELCTAGGAKQIGLFNGPSAVNTHLGSLNTFLNTHDLRTRHFVSNLILDQVDEDTVDGKAVVLVVLHNAYSETPEFDYTATLKLKFVRDAGGIWRIIYFLILGDTSQPGSSGVRGR